MSEYVEDFKTSLKSVSIELSRIEQLLRDNGLNVPIDNIVLKDDEKIRLPYGYIRTVSYYLREYNLNFFYNDKVIARNIAYALQTSDLFNYFLNRFRIGLSVGKIFLKHAIINHFSIIEAILYGIVKKYHNYCIFENVVCRYNNMCAFYFKKANKYNFQQLLDELINRNLLSMPPEIKENLLNIKGLRDNIHIWDAESRDYFNDEYSLQNYNFLVLCLKSIRDNLKDSLTSFESQRKNECKMLTTGSS